MRKIITILLSAVFFICSGPILASKVVQPLNQSEIQNKRELKRLKKKELSKQKTSAPTAVSGLNDQKKQELEAKESSVGKKKKVKRFSSDENLRETVRKRNIP